MTSTTKAPGMGVSSMNQSGPPGGSAKGAPGGKGGANAHILIQNIVICCNLQTEDWLKIFSSIALIVSAALLAFLVCYHVGVFHFERFMGPIGSISTLTGVGALVALSGVLLCLSIKR